MSLLETIRAKRAALTAEIDTLIATVEAEERSALTADEDTTLSSKIEERNALDSRVSQLEAEETRRSADAEARKVTGNVGGAVVTSEPEVYSRGGKSYFADLVRGATGDFDASRRLSEHGIQTEKRMAEREKRAVSTSTVGSFLPPLWLVDEYVPFLRAGRTTANLTTNETLPTGISSVNLPKVSTGSSEATQTEGGSVSSTSLASTSVTGTIFTVAGQNDVSLQAISQSGVDFDQVIFKDLLSAYNQQIDLDVITAITAVSGINAVTYTSGSPTAGGVYTALAQGVSQVAKNRFAPANSIVLHPSTYYSLVGALDSTGRPLVVPAPAALNPLAVGGGNAVAEGYTGYTIAGVNVYLDANLPVNLGGGTNQAEALVLKSDDIFLYEGQIQTRAMQEVLSGTLQVRVQLYNFAAIIANRYPASISVAGGTGFVPPTGF